MKAWMGVPVSVRATGAGRGEELLKSSAPLKSHHGASPTHFHGQTRWSEKLTGLPAHFAFPYTQFANVNSSQSILGWGAGLVNFHLKVFQTKNLGPSAPSLRQGQFWLNDGKRSSGYSFYGRKEHGVVASGSLPQEKDSKVNPRTLCGLSQHPISCCPPFLAISHCPVLLITPHSLCGIIPFFKNIFLKLISLF